MTSTIQTEHSCDRRWRQEFEPALSTPGLALFVGHVRKTSRRATPGWWAQRVAPGVARFPSAADSVPGARLPAADYRHGVSSRAAIDSSATSMSSEPAIGCMLGQAATGVGGSSLAGWEVRSRASSGNAVVGDVAGGHGGRVKSPGRPPMRPTFRTTDRGSTSYFVRGGEAYHDHGRFPWGGRGLDRPNDRACTTA